MWAKLFSFIGTLNGRWLIEKVAMFLAIKTILVFLFIIVIPLLFNNMIYELMETIFNFTSVQQAGVEAASPMTITGIAGYLLTVFRLPEIISIVTSALQLRLVLKMVPFSPL